MPYRVFVLALCVGSAASTAGVAAEEPTRRQLDFFEKKIRPVLVEHCYECHAGDDADKIDGGLRVDLRAGLRQGGQTGSAVVPGDVRQSLLISAIEYRDLEMPPEGKLPDEVIADFRRWVAMGAPDPRDGEMPGPDAGAESDGQSSADLWSLKPVTNPPVPPVKDASRMQIAADAFVLAKLEQAGLEPVAAAESLPLLRRLSFDLTGLPPTPDVQRQFEQAFTNNPEQAVAETVDKLLASPQFGERWARHWMDAVRYGESAGNSRDVLMPQAWRYRDYLIDAFNADIPYDRFLTEQIAGDLLPAETVAEADRLLIATGLLAIGSKSLNGGNLELDIADDQIDVIGKAVLGLTVSCARCHDHKFDPIPTADYYGLVGIFRSTETFYGGSTKRPKNDVERAEDLLVLGDQAEERLQEVVRHEQRKQKLEKQKSTVGKTVAKLTKQLPKNWQERKDELTTALNEAGATATEEESEDDPRKALPKKDQEFLKTVDDYETARAELADANRELKKLGEVTLPQLEFALGVRDKEKISDAPIQLRGEKNKRGEVVPRGFLSCVSVAEVPAVSDQQSGRQELAQWLTRSDHPLTARVAVNRIWQHLFGRGIVESVDNFGVNGAARSHPELLDHLAYRFVHEHGWSVKGMIRELVSSGTYQLSTTLDATNHAVDPGNALYWRMSRKRLEAEPLRDAMLAVSGELNLERPTASIVTRIGEGEVGRGINTKLLDEPFPYRSVYLPIIRGIVPEPLKLFDLPEPSNPQGQRDVTNVPAQALYLMNSPFVLQQADGLADRLLKEAETDEDRVRLVYRWCYAREPIAEERDRVRAFLNAAVPADGDDAKRQAGLKSAWSGVAQALMAGAEFRFLD